MHNNHQAKVIAVGSQLRNDMAMRWITLVVCLAAIPAQAQEPPRQTGNLELPRVGEEFTYAVDYTGVIGAYIKVKVGAGPKDNPSARVLTAYLATTPLIQQIWRIRDKLMSLYTPDEGRTLATRMWEDENGKRMFREERYHAKGVDVVERRNEGQRSFDVDSKQPLLDGFSALFDLRRRPLLDNTPEYARIYLNRKIYDCAAQVRRENIEYQGVQVATIRIDPVLSHAGKAIQDVRFTFWLSDDANRVPLRIEADVRYGKLAGTLLPAADDNAGSTSQASSQPEQVLSNTAESNAL